MSDEQKIKCKCVFGFGLGPGLGDAMPGDIIDLPRAVYLIEMDLGRVQDLPADNSAAQAAALQQAHAELLEKIAAAPDAQALESLLSEDPEIAAAYEKRIQELEETKQGLPAPPDAAKQNTPQDGK